LGRFDEKIRSGNRFRRAECGDFDHLYFLCAQKRGGVRDKAPADTTPMPRSDRQDSRACLPFAEQPANVGSSYKKRTFALHCGSAAPVFITAAAYSDVPEEAGIHGQYKRLGHR
jgi:hypothetical protein